MCVQSFTTVKEDCYIFIFVRFMYDYVKCRFSYSYSRKHFDFVLFTSIYKGTLLCWNGLGRQLTDSISEVKGWSPRCLYWVYVSSIISRTPVKVITTLVDTCDCLERIFLVSTDLLDSHIPTRQPLFFFLSCL